MNEFVSVRTTPMLSDPDITEVDSQPWPLPSDDEPTELLRYQLCSAEAEGLTNVGQERYLNEDFFVIQHQVTQYSKPHNTNLSLRGLYILCDGMGGHAQGEVASALAAQTLSDYFRDQWLDASPNHEHLRDAVLAANDAIYRLNEEQVSLGQDRMGTTLVLAMLHETHLHVAHVGDSRLYAFSQSRGLEQLTVDHEVAQLAIKNGMQPAVAYARPDAYQLTQALGPRATTTLNPDINTFSLSEDILLLLCSDGLTDNDLLENHSETHLQPCLSFEVGLQDCVDGLIKLANEKNGHDNITVIAVRLAISHQE